MMIIPTFEPEVIEAAARKRFHGDDERVATTSIKEVMVDGVKIGSRYGKAHELALVATVLSEMPQEECVKVRRVWCDSKHHTYRLVTASKTALQHFANGMIRHNAGYNEIYTSDINLYCGPWWPDSGKP